MIQNFKTCQQNFLFRSISLESKKFVLKNFQIFERNGDDNNNILFGKHRNTVQRQLPNERKA